MKLSNTIKIIALCIGFSVLTACATVGGLSQQQAKILQQEGFIYTDEGWTLDMPTSLLFGTDEHNLSIATQQKIASLMQKLQKINLNKIIVQGHTDNIGAREYNQELSLKRAQSVASIATSNGFSSQHVQAIGYADLKPVATNDTEEGRGENRRVAVIIVP